MPIDLDWIDTTLEDMVNEFVLGDEEEEVVLRKYAMQVRERIRADIRGTIKSVLDRVVNEVVGL